LGHQGDVLFIHQIKDRAKIVTELNIGHDLNSKISSIELRGITKEMIFLTENNDRDFITRIKTLKIIFKVLGKLKEYRIVFDRIEGNQIAYSFIDSNWNDFYRDLSLSRFQN
jgi:hypothetical protein